MWITKKFIPAAGRAEKYCGPTNPNPASPDRRGFGGLYSLKKLVILDHQNKLIAETPNELANKLLALKNQSRNTKKGNKDNRPERQILTNIERQEILKKTDGRCHICGGLITGKWDADHIKAHSRGGTHKIDNYLPAHSLCNNYRWDYLEEEFQLIIKIGIWCKKQIRDKTALGLQLADGFIKYERNRLKRRKF